EDAYLKLEEERGVDAVTRARALLAVEEQATQITGDLEKSAAKPAKAVAAKPMDIRERFKARVAAANAQVVGLKSVAQAKPNREPELEPKPKKSGEGAAFSIEKAKPDNDAVILSKQSPYDNARGYVRRRCFKDGVL